jgi:ribonucleoside-triphosphate reductase
MAKKFLEDAGISYETIVVNDNPDAARKLGIKQAPTLVILEGETVVQKIENPSNIRAYTEAVKA